MAAVANSSSLDTPSLIMGAHQTKTPLWLYHGWDSITYKGAEARERAMSWAQTIIKQGALLPGGIYTDRRPKQYIFQHIAGNLTVEDHEKLEVNLWPFIDIGDYLTQQKTRDPAFYQTCQELNNQRPFIGTFEIPNNLTSEEPRRRTTCFYSDFSESYGEYITFHFKIDQEQLEKLERINPSGKSFFDDGIIRCTQELPLAFASEIILGSGFSNTEHTEQQAEILRACLKEKNLQHIKVVTKKTRQLKPIPPKIYEKKKLDFDVPMGETVKLTTEQLYELEISVKDYRSSLEQFKDSVFTCEREKFDEMNPTRFRMWLLTRTPYIPKSEENKQNG